MKDLLNMHPFQLVLLTVCGLCALLGLFLFANYSGFGGNSNKVGAVVIWGTLPTAAVQAELTQIQAVNKTYTKVTYVQRPAATFDTDLTSAIASGSGPDLVLIDQEQLLSEEPILSVLPFSAIPQRTFLNTFLPEGRMYLTTNGMYGIPYVLDPLVLYYNRTILANAGISEPPTTWEAIAGLAPTISKTEGAQAISQSTIPFGEYSNIEDARAILSLLFLQAGSQITQVEDDTLHSVLASDNGQSFTGSSPTASALSFYTQFSDPTRTVYSWNTSFTSAQQQFLAGNVAFYVGFASEQPTLAAGNPNLDFDMAAIPQPATATNKVDYALMYAFVIPKASHNPTGALLTAEELTNKTYLPTAASALSMAPGQNGLLTPSASDQFAPVYYPLALVATGWLSPTPSIIDTIFSDMITSVTSGALTTSDAVSTASEALDAALQPSS